MQTPSPNSRIKKFSQPHTWVVEETTLETYREIQATPSQSQLAYIPKDIQKSKAASQTAYLQAQINARKAAGHYQQRIEVNNRLTSTTAQLQAQVDAQRRRSKAPQS